jgi:hypothetical protein
MIFLLCVFKIYLSNYTTNVPKLQLADDTNKAELNVALCTKNKDPLLPDGSGSRGSD